MLPLCTVFIELARLIDRRIQDKVASHGLSSTQAMAMLRIACRPRLSRADLARGLQVSPQAAGQLVTQLVDKGLACRTESGPGMAIELCLTPEGHRLVALFRPTVESVSAEILRFFRPNLGSAINGAIRHIRLNLAEE